MKILTRDFGEVDIQPQDVIEFKLPIYGFDGLKKYVILFEEENRHIVWLQSLEEPGICFVMVDPAIIDSGYHPKLPPVVARTLGEGEYLYWFIAVIAKELPKSTVNMKSPVIVNPQTGCGLQIILDDDYPIRRPLFEPREG